MVNRWKVTAIISICLLILTLALIYGLLNTHAIISEYERNNIRSCAIGCYIKGFGDSYILDNVCRCGLPFVGDT